MPFADKRLIELQRTARRWAIAGGALLLIASGWTIWAWTTPRPLVQAVQLRPAPTPSAATLTRPHQPLDLAAFNAPIWNPTPPPKPPTPLPPLRLQLIAVTRETASDGTPQFRALVYDADTDVLTQVAAGDRVAGRAVTTITASGVELIDGTSTRRLALDPTGGSP